MHGKVLTFRSATLRAVIYSDAKQVKALSNRHSRVLHHDYYRHFPQGPSQDQNPDQMRYGANANERARPNGATGQKAGG